jgi:hypothetical protein
VEGYFGFLAQFLFSQVLHSQQHVDVDHLVEVARDPFEFGEHVFPQWRCDVQVVAADRQVHVNSFRWGERPGTRGRAAMPSGRHAAEPDFILRLIATTGKADQAGERALSSVDVPEGAMP